MSKGLQHRACAATFDALVPRPFTPTSMQAQEQPRANDQQGRTQPKLPFPIGCSSRISSHSTSHCDMSWGRTETAEKSEPLVTERW